ncbi:MAG: hypothetical protein Q4F13_04655 [Pseudomonadota bacterium]|nr:hypothetical protein [Pseudomonadota bacterium]
MPVVDRSAHVAGTVGDELMRTLAARVPTQVDGCGLAAPATTS